GEREAHVIRVSHPQAKPAAKRTSSLEEEVPVRAMEGFGCDNFRRRRTALPALRATSSAREEEASSISIR
ncbi:MAG TPA: hypothetical protein V6D47_15590, partial [Oscillatoriaceae cyanobacterium]